MRVLRAPLFWLAIAAIVRVVLVQPWIWPDSHRYLSEAESLLRGAGYATDGVLETYFPPGYPVFVAAVFWVWHSLPFLVAVQIALSIASCWLIYLAVRPRGDLPAVIALAAMALHFWIALFAGAVLAETLAIFLASLLVHLLSKVEQDTTSVLVALCVGVSCMSLALTVPLMAPVGAAIVLSVAFERRKRFAFLAALFGGALLLYVPWQIHCQRAIGEMPLLTLYRFPKEAYLKRGLALWIRTWARTQDDMNAYVSAKYFDSIPDDAFASREQRSRLTSLHAQYREQLRIADKNRLSDSLDRLTLVHDRAFEAAALRRMRERPFSFHVVLPLIRSFHLWFDEPVYGDKMPIRFIGRIVWTSVSILYVLYPLLFLGTAALALLSRKPIPIAICIGTIAYTFLSAYTALGEERRNFEFIPLLLFLLFYLPARKPRRLRGSG